MYHSYGTVVTLTVVRPCHTSVQLSSESSVQPSAEQSFQQLKGMVGMFLLSWGTDVCLVVKEVSLVVTDKSLCHHICHHVRSCIIVYYC